MKNLIYLFIGSLMLYSCVSGNSVTVESVPEKSNGFVMGVGWLADQRASLDFFSFNLGKTTVSTAPLICLLIAAVFVILIKRIFRITRYHGPADSIYVAHHADDEPELGRNPVIASVSLGAPRFFHLRQISLTLQQIMAVVTVSKRVEQSVTVETRIMLAR